MGGTLKGMEINKTQQHRRRDYIKRRNEGKYKARLNR
jgi:hypothetical protein